jgi:diguanylate cyclase (GGDEF)-like protein
MQTRFRDKAFRLRAVVERMNNNRSASRPASPLTQEEARLGCLAALNLLDTPPERSFDTIVQLARRIMDCEIGLITLVDKDRQWFKAKCGLVVCETPRDVAFCAYAINSDNVMIVPDALADPRFCESPLVTGSPHIRFYAGAPLRVTTSRSGSPRSSIVGTLCIIDSKPRTPTARDVEQLRNAAHLVVTLIEARVATAHERELAAQSQGYARQLRRMNRQFRQAERMASVGSWRLTLADNRVEWSDQVYAIHEVSRDIDPGLLEALDFYPQHARATISGALANTMETGQPFDVETDFLTAEGRLRRVHSIGEIELSDRVPIAVIGVFQDVTERYALEQQLRAAAYTDVLTGLPNRARFNEFLDAYMADDAASGRPLTLLLIDLDGFKTVNDRCGHREGDILLQKVADCLRAPYLAHNFAARLGGDEFIILLSDQNVGVAQNFIVPRLLESLRHTIPTATEPIIVSGTIGISAWQGRGQDRSDLLHCADEALYEAKRAGGNRAVVSGEVARLSQAK